MTMKVSPPDSSSQQHLLTRRRRRSQPLQPKLSCVDSTASAYLAMLEGVALQVSLESDDVFVLSTSTNTSQRRYSFDELRRLKKRLLSAMQYGHLCHAECPWIYNFLKNYFPKKATLTLSAGKRSRQRRDAVEFCLTNVLQFVCDRKNRSCAAVSRDVAQELASALFGYDVNECSVQLLTPVDVCDAITRPSSSSLSSLSSSLSEIDNDELLVCKICSACLEHERDSEDGKSHSDSGRRASSVSSSGRGLRSPARSPAHYTITLSCGHQFHDECVVLKLNESMQCPTCGHDEVAPLGM